MTGKRATHVYIISRVILGHLVYGNLPCESMMCTALTVKHLHDVEAILHCH